MMEVLEAVANLTYGGVDPTIPGNGGVDCYEYLSLTRRAVETVLITVFAISLIVSNWRKAMEVTASVPPSSLAVIQGEFGRRFLLLALALVFGVELGFKLSTRTLVYVLNPCHVTTSIQLLLLFVSPSACDRPWVSRLFKFQLTCMVGPLFALMFPVLNTRLLPCEQVEYFVQHGLMFIIPFYLFSLGGPFLPEPFWDISFQCVCFGIHLLYHFWLLQAVAMLTQVNLNGMLCNLVSDPFQGPNYRMVACTHQALAVPLFAKLFCVFGMYFWTGSPWPEVESAPSDSDHLRDFSSEHSKPAPASVEASPKPHEE